jgi:HK97 family phage major capsid protein
MPYTRLDDLPDEVRDRLDADQQAQWLAVFNEVFEETGDEEAAVAAAWGAVRKAQTFVSIKSVADGEYEHVVAGWGMLFTDAGDADLEDEFFTRATETLLEYYDSGPLWYEHRQDKAYGDTPIGKRTDLKVYPRGIWVEHGLDPDHPQVKRTVEEVEAGELAYSSDTAAQLWERVSRGDAVEITSWPVIGWSLTKTPAEPGLGPVSLKAFSLAVKRASAGTKRNISKAMKELDDMGKKIKREILEALAGAFGVEADLDLVSAKMAEVRQVIELDAGGGGIEGGAGEVLPAEGDTGKATVDLAALAAALGLPEDAAPEQLLEALEAVLEAMYAEAEGAVEPAAGMSAGDGGDGKSAGPGDEDEDKDEDEEPEQVIQDYKILRTAAKRARGLLDRQVTDPIPGFHRPRPASASGGAGAAKATGRGGRSRRSFQTGTIKRPGLAELVVGTIKGDQRMIRAAAKAVATFSGPSGAYVLNHVTVDDLIDPLYATEVVMAAGAQVERFPGAESVTYPKLNAGAAAYWAAEGVSVKGSTPAFSYLTVYPKRLIAKYLVPNRALRNATVQLEQKLQDNLSKSLRLQMDYGFLFGIGAHPGGDHSGKQPLGLVNVEGVSKTALGANGARPKIKDLMDAVGRVEDANVELGESAAWIFNPRDKRSFTGMTDTTGQPLLRLDGWESKEERDLLGYPWFTSTQVPKAETVGTSDDCSYIIFGEWEEFLVAISQDAELVIDTSRYVEESMTLIQVETHVDCGVFRPEAFDVTTGVRAA